MVSKIRAPRVAIREKGRGTFRDYVELIKPRETGLLLFIGAITAILAGNGFTSISRFLLVIGTLLIASGGANGLTNYLDRDIDARMQRTRNRVLPAGKIYPAERALIFTAGLTAAGLILAWYLSPLVFLADIVGTMAAVVYRKRVTCVFPQGMVASCTPILMGWLAVTPTLNGEVFLLCILIAVWLPAHIWSVMMAHKEDYRQAGITYFPLNYTMKTISRILAAFSILLLAASIGLYFVGHLGLIYLLTAIVLGIILVYSSLHLMISGVSRDAWKLYKLSAFPYLGLLFLAMGLDIWLKI